MIAGERTREGVWSTTADSAAFAAPRKKRAIQEIPQDVVQALEQGRAIIVAPHDTELTTQEVANELGISRPTVVKLLERGEIPYARRGNRRKVRLADVRTNQDRMRHTAHAELDAMSADGEDDEVYDDTAEPVRTR